MSSGYSYRTLMYREIVILLSSPQYFFPLFALVSLSRRLSSDIFSARRYSCRGIGAD